MSEDFDAAVASTLQPSPAQAARVGFSVAADTNPDAHAEALRVARRTGVPVDTVTAYPQEMKRQAAVGSIDFDTLAKTSPATAALLADVEKAKVSHDDVEGLANTENALKAWKGPAPSFASVAGGLAESLKFKPLIAGLRLAFNDALFGAGGDVSDQVRRADLVRKAGQAQAQQDYTTPAFESSTASGLYSGGVSIMQNLPGLAASILTGSPAPGLALAGINSAAPAYGKYSARGALAGEAALGAGMEGSIEVLTEALPMGFLVKNFGRAGFGEFMTGLLGREIPTEIIATLTQNLTDAAIANPDVTMADYLKAQPDAVYQTILATLVQSAAMGGAGKIVQVATGRAQAVQDAERGGEYLDKLNQAIAASKVLQRDPETFEQFVSSAAEGAPVQAVFIDANTLLQSGVAEQVIAASPAVASQIQQAAQIGGQIAIPIDEYAAKIAPTDAAGTLLDHLKTDPEGFSRAEAQQYMQSHAEELRAEVERAMEDRQGHDAFRESADVVRAEIRKQLDDAGRFTGPANDAYATLVGNFFAVQAAKMGITPQELYARYPLNVTAQAVGGAQFDQAENSGNVSGMDDAEKAAVNIWRRLADAEDSHGKLGVLKEVRAIIESRPDLAGSVLIEAKNLGYDIEADGGLNLALIKASNASGNYLGVDSSALENYQGPDAVVSDGNRSENSTSGRDSSSVEPPRARQVDDNSVAVSDVGHISSRQEAKKIEDTVSDRAAKVSEMRIPPPEIPKKLSQKQFEGILQDIDAFGPCLPKDDPDRVREFRSILSRLKAAGVDYIDMYHVTDASIHDFITDGITGSSVDHAGAFSGRLRSKSVYGFLDPDDIQDTYDGVLGAESDTPNVIHIKIPVANIINFRWDSNFNVTFGSYSGVRFIGNVPPKWIDGAYKYDISTGKVIAVEKINKQSTSTGSDVLNQGPRGAFSPASNTITLLKAADLSTFLHETGHFFLEAQLDMSARLAAVQERTEGENEIIRDANALLAWFGLRDIHEWNALDFEEKRDYHERFARGFEAYLFEGKAPSIELQGVFQRFRAWLVNIYRDLKNLNVELTDEVRSVMDRMIATGEQIQLAERGRSMMPLFRTAEQAGMTPEEFAAYQALGAQSTADAVEDLQARGLRDLQWLRNARGREIARLQKQGETQRASLRMEVRREVMSQPVYRAWQFLTGKISEVDKLVPPERFKSDPDIVDPGIDSLFSAIAKLGGINRESAAGMWGVKPEDKPASGLFGKPVLRAEGKGLTVDQMAEKLAELGYLKHDENGNTALRDFEEAFHAEMGGSPVYSSQADYDVLRANSVRPGDQVIAGNLLTGRLDRAALSEIGEPAEAVAAVKALRMTADNGLHPDIVAELFGFSSGDELVRTLAEATPPKEEIDAITDQRMMEQFGELATPEAIARSADKAIHNDARARMIATEINALAKATGRRKVLASAAREYAAAMIARLRVRDIRPGQYASAEAKAARAAQKASQSGDLATSAAEKRNELVNNYATRAAYDAQEEVAAGVRYLKKFDSAAVRKALTADYADQIDALLERFDLRTGQSLTAIDKRAALADWIKSQQDAGIEPDIPPELLDGAFRKSFKDMTVEEFRGLLDAVKQIEHLGRLKQYLLTAKGRREYEAARNEIVASIELHADGRTADTRTPTTRMGRALQGLKRFGAAHIKAATWARIMDGGKDGGPMWEYFVRAANERGDMETTMRSDATKALSEIMTPVFAQPGRMGGKGQFFPTINRSLNREARIALALNVGNEGNLQRLLGGEGWTVAQIMPVLQSLTPQELVAVQQVWDHFESYRPQIAAKERRIYGKEPAWVAPGSAVTAQLGLRGGYYPIKYDPAASQRAEEHADAEGAKRQLQGAYTTATTRRSFTKSRVEEVSGRPLLYTLTGLYSGVNDVIHDLAWHEWLIDTNRLLRSKSIDSAIRNHYGPEVKGQFKTWAGDIAEGEKGTADAVDAMLGYVRQSVSVAGLGFNVVSAAMQPLGITQSIVRVGPSWVGRGIAKYIAHPISLTREVNEMSSFMENRARTRSRELNELRNQVQDQSAVKEWVGRYAYFLMMRFQQAVDVPTWWGAYERALAEGNDEERAISLADQGVIDSQGSGHLKDQAAIERVGAGGKLFTVFYSFMNTALNLGVQQGMTEKSAAKQAANYALLYLISPLLGMALKAAITPGDSGDDDPEKIARKLLSAEIDYLMGLFVGLRELSDAAKTLTGANDMGRDYQGPAGLRLFADIGKFAMQAHQGDLDDAFRKAFINLMGDLFGLPAAQINRTITGTQALAEGETENPAAIVFGFQRKH